MKTCNHCKTEKPLSEFYGSKIWCKACHIESSKKSLNRIKSDPYLFKKWTEKRKAKYEKIKETWHLQPDRICNICQVLKPISEYYFNFYTCKPCSLTANKRYRNERIKLAKKR